MLKNYEYQSEFAREYFGKGVAEGRAKEKTETTAKNVLHILRTRSVCVSDEARRRILGCQDLGQLQTWLERAITASSTRELFQD
ncbi:hypothetical protein ACRB68_41130 [Actinomadura sp. RB68]|uniref:Uncharacterized protein n=2 Tax=Actinomadura macrotermitis TaxID=2585200 RepID=A0A7K0BXX6_9ACTN|nr:hypothetical protein [Actinomadura macrotermitis]